MNYYLVIQMTDKTRTVLIGGFASCGKTLYLKKLAEYYYKQGKKVFIVGEDDKKECISCKYFYKYPNGRIHCFMKYDIYLLNNKNVYPKQCKDYERGGLKND